MGLFVDDIIIVVKTIEVVNEFKNVFVAIHFI